MSLVGRMQEAWRALKGRLTRGLLWASSSSILVIVVLNLSSSYFHSSELLYAVYTVAVTLASSVFAACVVSVMFDLKSIRDLIVKNDADLLLKMLLKSDELFSTEGGSGEHEAILHNIRLKSTAALNGIDLSVGMGNGSDIEMRKGHVRTCLASLDDELDKAYAKYVNIARHIRNEGCGVFEVDEVTYVRYMNDTSTPKKVRAWNHLRSAQLPPAFKNPRKDVLTEEVKVTVNDGIPRAYRYESKCEMVGIQGIGSLSRRWKCQWDDDLCETSVPPHGTCVVEMRRTFYIPECEEISYTWNTVRAECRYEVNYSGDDHEPMIHIVDCDRCETEKRECSRCDQHAQRRIIDNGNTKIAVLKDWPNLGTAIKVTWV